MSAPSFLFDSTSGLVSLPAFQDLCENLEMRYHDEQGGGIGPQSSFYREELHSAYECEMFHEAVIGQTQNLRH